MVPNQWNTHAMDHIIENAIMLTNKIKTKLVDFRRELHLSSEIFAPHAITTGSRNNTLHQNLHFHNEILHFSTKEDQSK